MPALPPYVATVPAELTALVSDTSALQVVVACAGMVAGEHVTVVLVDRSVTLSENVSSLSVADRRREVGEWPVR